jgi:hypothetical protein
VEGIPKSVTTQTSPHGHLYLDGDPGTKSVIQDALIGVYINHGAKFQAKDYKFSNNHIHVAIRNGNYEFTEYGYFSHYPYIQNCEFGYTLKGMPNYQPYCEGCEEYCFESFRDPPLSKMIYIEETRFFEIENNKFSETSIGKNRTAISGYDAGLAKIYTNTIEGGLKYGYYFDSLSNSMILNDSFEASSTTKIAGVYLEYSDSININDVSFAQAASAGVEVNNSDSIRVGNSDFYGNMVYGIDVESTEKVNIASNTFESLDSLRSLKNGVYLKDVQGGVISANNFNKLELANVENAKQKGTGVQSYLSGAYNKPLNINNNTFDSTRFGIVLAPHEYPVVEKSWTNWGWHIMNVNMTCNTFKDNAVGILGSGNIKDQVYDSIGAANTFNEASMPDSSANRNYDILWSNIDPGIFAYYYDSGTYAPNSDTNLAKNGVLINGYVLYKSDHQNLYIDSIVECGSLNKRSTSNAETITSKPGGALKVYPNPFKEELIVEAKKPLKRVVVKDMLGHLIIKKTAIDDRKLNIDTRAFAEGFYLIQAFDQTMNRLTNKVLKVD